MDYYYAWQNQRQGPLSEEAFKALVAEGRITDTTLVWRQGLAEWIPFSQLRPELLGMPAAGTAPDAAATPASAAGPADLCCECGGRFPQEEMVSLQGRWVCANCKPLFLQRLREGVPLPNERVFAGFWIRFAAKFVDGLITGVFTMGVPFLLMGGIGVGAIGRASGVAILLSYLFSFLFTLAYSAWFVGRFGATPGKMACKLEVITADGGKVSYARACGRYFGEILSGLVCYIGYIMVGFDQEKRALHDHVCSTRVVYRQR